VEVAQYREYLKSFNGRDYDRVLSFWGASVHCLMDGVVLFDSPASLKTFYAFLHSYVDESIHLDRYLSDEDNLFLEGRVRIAAKRSMSAQAIVDSGFSSLKPIEAGTTFDLPQIIHYHLENGKFVLANCLMSGPPIRITSLQG
jgi:hypothetical protein